MRLTDYADRRFRLAGKPLLRTVQHFMGPVEDLPAGVISFGNYDYLGLARDERLREAACAAVRAKGVGVSASRLVGGERHFHAGFEAALADFIGTEAALCLVSGYLTNLTVIGHLLGARDLLLVDALSHNSIMAGSSCSRAYTNVFRHNDLDHLEILLAAEREKFGRCLIVVEGLYSMDGDVPDLPRLLALKNKYDAWLLVDEAHSIGVLGRTGRGLTEHWGINPREVDIIIGTLSKTFATCGGFVAAAQIVLDWFHYTLPGFVFSVGMAPPIAAAAHQALRILRAEPERVTKLQANSSYFIATAQALGLATGPAAGHGVVPLLFRDNQETVWCANALLEAGFYCPPIVQVGVPRDQPRLRFFLSSMHETGEILRALEVVADAVAAYREDDVVAAQ
jgi:8-amino-7-oxononanoate synthase